MSGLFTFALLFFLLGIALLGEKWRAARFPSSGDLNDVSFRQSSPGAFEDAVSAQQGSRTWTR